MKVTQSEEQVVVGMEWMVLGGSWVFGKVCRRESGGTIIGFVGISSSTMAIGGLT